MKRQQRHTTGTKRLFPDGGLKITLRLVSSMTTAGGLAILSYEP